MRQRPLLAAPLNIGRSSKVSPLALIGGGRLPFIQAGWKPQRIVSSPTWPSRVRITGTDCVGETLKRGSIRVSARAPRPKRAAMSSGEVSVYRPHMGSVYAVAPWRLLTGPEL